MLNGKFKLRLFITGYTSNSQQAIRNLEFICNSELANECEVEVIDILERPGLAERDKIVATPTLIKIQPEPVKRIVGDLGDHKKVLHSLELYREITPYKEENNQQNNYE